MASRKKKICHVLSYIVILIYFQTSTAMNIDCGGKPFHCLNSTHFMICVDFGTGISKTVDEFVIRCPSTTVCRRNNRFECEYELPTTTESTTGLGDETNNFELNEQLTTISPFRETSDTRLLLSKYLNTVSVTTQTDIVTHKSTQDPGTLKITDISFNNTTISSTRATYLNNSVTTSEKYGEEKLLKPPLIGFQNTTAVVTLLKELKDKELFQERTITPFPEETKDINPKVIDGKTINLINGTSTSHISGINNEAENLNESDTSMKLSDTTLYDSKTVSQISALTTLDSQNVLNSSNIVNTEILTSFNDVISPITMGTLNKENIIEESTAKPIKSSNNDVTNTILYTAIKTTSTEYAYPTIRRNADFDGPVLRIENSTRENERILDLKQQNILTERTVANTTEIVTTLAYNENILNATLSEASLITNDATTLSNEHMVFRNSSTTLKPVINSIADDIRSMKATKHINEIDFTSTIPYLINEAQITKEEITEKSEVQNTSLTEDTTPFTQDQILDKMNSATDTLGIITKNNTKLELLQQTTKLPNKLMNIKDINSLFKDVVKISTSSRDKEKFSSIFPTTDSIKIEIRNVPQETTASENTYTLSQKQIGIAIAGIEDLNLSNTDILVKTNLSKLAPNFVTANSVTDNIPSFNIKQENYSITNDVNENIISVKSQNSVQKMDKLGSDKSKIITNLTSTSLTASYSTESEQIPIVTTVHQNSISIDSRPTNNDTTTLSNDNLIFGYTLNTVKPVIKSTRDDTRSVKATERINEIEVISTIPYLIAKAQLTREDITESPETQSTTMTEDVMFFVQDEVTVQMNSGKETFEKIPKSNTEGELLPQTKILPKNLIDIKDNNYNSFKDKIPISDLEKEKLYVMSTGSELLTTIFPTPDSLKLDITIIPEQFKASENININILSKPQIDVAGIDNLNFSSTDSLAKVNLSTFKPNLVSANFATDSVTPVSTNLEINSFINDVNENMISVINKNSAQNVNTPRTDKSNMNINFTKTSVTASYTTKSEQLDTDTTSHQNSTSYNIMKVQDKTPAEMSTTETYNFFKSKLSATLSSEPIVTTVNNNTGKTNNEGNERLESFNSAVTINDHYRTADVHMKKDYFLSKLSPTSIYVSKSFGISLDLLSNVKENFTLTSKGKHNDVPTSPSLTTLQADSESLDILSNIVTESVFPYTPIPKQNDVNAETNTENTTRYTVRFNRKLQDNITTQEYYDQRNNTDSVKMSEVDSKTYISKNLLQGNANFPDSATVTTILNILSNNQSFSNIGDQISLDNFTSENIRYGGNTDSFPKDYKPDSSTYQNDLKVNTDVKTPANFQTFTNKIDDVYATYTKYDLLSKTTVERLHEMFTTDISTNVDNVNILEGSEIFKYKPLSGSTKTDHMYIKNDVIEKPLTLSSTEQPLEGKDNTRNVIPDVYSTSTTKAVQLDVVLQNFVSEITILENNNTSLSSTGLKAENFNTTSTVSPSTITAPFIRKVSFESSTPKLKEKFIQVATIYTGVATTNSQTVVRDAENTNVNNANNHNMDSYDNVKANFTVYNLSNTEKEQKNLQVRNTETPSFGNITDKGKKIVDINAKDVLQNANKSHGQLSKHITVTEVPYFITAELMGKSLRDKKEAKVYANNVQFTCRSRFRARYANKDDCRKFYICIGKNQPILGECPVNTVFSEIKKQCTKTLSHCLINNQFRCIQEGRFSDVLKNHIYYICVKNKNTYVRFQFQCQAGYYLNKTTVRCVSGKQMRPQISSISVDNESYKASDQSTVERKSKETKQADLVENNICKDEGKFWDPNDCRRYYICTKNSKSVYRRRNKKCDSDEVFHREKKKCVKDDSYECA